MVNVGADGNIVCTLMASSLFTAEENLSTEEAGHCFLVS